MSYVYDPVGGSMGEDNFITTYNHETQLCADGTTDCIYTEKFDENRKLIEITNSKGVDFIRTFIDDVWSGKINLDKNPLFKTSILKMVEFNRETGELFFKMGEKKVKIIPGNMQFEAGADAQTFNVSVGMIVLYIIFYYYANGLPKPTIKLDLSSKQTFGELYAARRSMQSQP